MRYLAFDVGAESGRAMVGTLRDQRLILEEIHRFANEPVRVTGHLHWDVLRLFHEMKKGLRLAAAKYGAELASMAVDTWGVDFGLLDEIDCLLGNPFHYRDNRTQGLMEEVFKKVRQEEIFHQTGIQFLPINSIYQLMATKIDQPGMLAVAHTLLLMPDLFKFFFSGVKETEFTIATTTQAFDSVQGRWAVELLDSLGLPSAIFPPVVRPGSVSGRILPGVAKETGAPAVAVVAVGSHDTASAVVAVPGGDGDYLYISSGTWSLIGTRVSAPVINAKVLAADFSNEGGVEGCCLHKNIAGLWLVQECRRIWERRGEILPYTVLSELARQAEPLVSFMLPNAAAFLNPDDMPIAIQAFCRDSGQVVPEGKGEVIRCALESLALEYRLVLDRLEDILQKQLPVIHIVGGGINNELLCQFTANATGRLVAAGPVEATAIGNILVQAVAMGQVKSLSEGRRIVRTSFEVKTYKPKDIDRWQEAYTRYLALQGLYNV